MRIVKLPNKQNALSLMFAADGRTLAVSQPGVVSLFDPLALSPTVRTLNHEQLDGTDGAHHRVVSATADGGFLSAWGVRANRFHPAREACEVISFAPVGLHSFHVSPDGRHAVGVVGVNPNGLRLWRIGDGLSAEHLYDSQPHTGLAWSWFGFHPDGQRLVLAGWDQGEGILAAHDLATGRRLAVTGMPITRPERVAVSPDGTRIAVLAVASVHLFDAHTFDAFNSKPVRIANPGRRKLQGIALHPNGKHLLTTGRDALVRVWEVRTGKEVNAFAWGVGRLTALAVSPDGTLCAAAGSHGRVVVWDWDG